MFGYLIGHSDWAVGQGNELIYASRQVTVYLKKETGIEAEKQ
jgi:hypothetical protein